MRNWTISHNHGQRPESVCCDFADKGVKPHVKLPAIGHACIPMKVDKNKQ